MRSVIIVLSLASVAAASSPGDAVAAALEDIAKFRPISERKYQRYLWVPQPTPQLRVAIRLHINLISKEPEMADVVEVKPWLWRLDLQEIDGDPNVWEKAAAIDPFFHDQANLVKVGRKKVAPHAPWLRAKDIELLAALTRSDAPVIHAGWFIARSARQLDQFNQQTGFGLYDWLGIKDRTDYFNLIGLDQKSAEKRKKEIRAALDISGISPTSRQIVGLDRKAWFTLDSFTQKGRGVAIANLVKGTFVHDAERHYGHLPNDLPAVGLFDKDGVRQDFAPADAGAFGDDSPLNLSRDPRIHVGVNCWTCHAGKILQPIDDWTRRTYVAGGPLALAGKNKRQTIELRRQYLSDLDGGLEDSRALFTRAIRKATVTVAYPTGLEPQRTAEIYTRAFFSYATFPVTRKQAALELGITEEQFKIALYYNLKKHPPLDPRLAPFLGEPGKLSRLTWEDTYSLAQTVIRGYIPAKR